MRYTDYLEELDKSKEYRNAEDELKIHFELAKAVVRARINKGWSQEE